MACAVDLCGCGGGYSLWVRLARVGERGWEEQNRLLELHVSIDRIKTGADAEDEPACVDREADQPDGEPLRAVFGDPGDDAVVFGVADCVDGGWGVCRDEGGGREDGSDVYVVVFVGGV